MGISHDSHRVQTGWYMAANCRIIGVSYWKSTFALDGEANNEIADTEYKSWFARCSWILPFIFRRIIMIYMNIFTKKSIKCSNDSCTDWHADLHWSWVLLIQYSGYDKCIPITKACIYIYKHHQTTFYLETRHVDLYMYSTIIYIIFWRILL